MIRGLVSYYFLVMSCHRGSVPAKIPKGHYIVHRIGSTDLGHSEPYTRPFLNYPSQSYPSLLPIWLNHLAVSIVSSPAFSVDDLPSSRISRSCRF